MKTVDAPFCQHSFSLPTEAFSVPRVRAEAAKIFADWGLTREVSAVDVALLALSELMTNCVQHASADSPFADVTLTEEAGDLVIAVHDRHPRMPRVLTQPHADHIGGRGLLLVQRLATEEGGATVMTPDLDGEGKTVTVRLPLRPRDEYAASKEIAMIVARPSVVATDAIVIRPSGPLTGSVHVDGSKNAALPLLAAAAAVRHPVHLSNVPTSGDVQAMLTLLQQCGYHIARPVTDPSTTVILPTDQLSAPPDLPDAGRIRASYYLVPALLAACGQARLPWPGGCSIGERGMEQHFKVYEAFGDEVTVGDKGYQVRATATAPRDVVIGLPFRSRGASIAAILRAVVARCQLRLGNPNLSPEVDAVLIALSAAGWDVRRGEDTLVIAPLPHVAGNTTAWTVPGDKIEAGTLACAIAATGGTGRIDGVRGTDVEPLVEILNWLGIPATAESHALVIHSPQDRDLTQRPLRAVASLSPGGLDADFEPPLMALALGLPGTHLFADDINPGRHTNLLPQLCKLGAAVEELSPTRCRLTGPQQLAGATVEATDIRTGSALIIAALTAHGSTTLTGLAQLRRGHTDLPAKLRALGADITEVGQ